ncbi:MAG: ribonuclease HII [Muribaculaceae bacterium]|nr:ribonuclease HII [Muribaculaceae bacterium]
MALQTCLIPAVCEAGCDEAGRGCLAGPVTAAAVILPDDFYDPLLNDSKQLTDLQRRKLRPIIEANAIAWALGWATAEEIDQINILRASILAMHRALDGLKVRPGHIAVDGNRFIPYSDIPHRVVVHGDALLANIAAASVLAKTARDDYMEGIAAEFPLYGWSVNKGYPTKAHRAAIAANGPSPHHRKTFRLL